MKNYTKPNQTRTGPANLKSGEGAARCPEEVDLLIEELEEVIAPMVQQDFHRNHNETLVRDAEEIELDVEELEQVIAPGKRMNHNETIVRDVSS